MKAISEFNKGHIGKMHSVQSDSDFVGVDVFKLDINWYKVLILRYDGIIICTCDNNTTMVCRGRI